MPRTDLDITLSLLHPGRQQMPLSVHRHPTEPASGSGSSSSSSDLSNKLAGWREDDDPGVGHDDLPGWANADRGQLLELPLALSLPPDLLLQLPAALEDEDASDSVIGYQYLVLIVDCHGYRLN